MHMALRLTASRSAASRNFVFRVFPLLPGVTAKHGTHTSRGVRREKEKRRAVSARGGRVGSVTRTRSNVWHTAAGRTQGFILRLGTEEFHTFSSECLLEVCLWRFKRRQCCDAARLPAVMTLNSWKKSGVLTDAFSFKKTNKQTKQKKPHTHTHKQILIRVHHVVVHSCWFYLTFKKEKHILDFMVLSI